METGCSAFARGGRDAQYRPRPVGMATRVRHGLYGALWEWKIVNEGSSARNRATRSLRPGRHYALPPAISVSLGCNRQIAHSIGRRVGLISDRLSTTITITCVSDRE